MEISLKISAFGRMFMMPASVVDEYLKISTGEQIKVLMCIYCLGSEKIRTEDISAMSGVPEQAVREAVIHFSKLGVFAAEGLTGAEKISEPAPAPVKPVQPAPKTADDLALYGQPEAIRGTSRDTSRDSRVHYTPKELASKIESDNALKALRDEMEQILATPLKPSNVGDIIEMYEHLELDPASIQMIAEYCKSLGKCKTAYILSVAQDWFDEGICNFEQIERKIINMSAYSSLEGRVLRLIGQQGTATKKQREFVHSWQDMGFEFEMIELAYEKNVDQKGKFSFPYMNKILQSWHEKGITTPKQAEQESEDHKNSKPASNAGKGISAKEVEEFAASIDFDKLTT